MTHDQHELASTKVDVSGLLDSPGAQRPVDIDVPAPDGFEVPLTVFGDVVEVHGMLDGLIEGVLLRGEVRVQASQRCALCLVAQPAFELSADVAELFTDPKTVDEPGDVEEGYEIVDAMIDVDALIRDALAAAADPAPRCRADCAGLCPTCGINRNEGTCECSDELSDDRWAALASLKLDN